jgi:hypothetical protein
MRYPLNWNVELDPKSDRNKGNVAFKSPDKTNILVSWGPLEEAKKKYSSPEKFAMDAVNRIKEDRQVKRVELVQTELEEINSHEANFTHIKIIKLDRSLLFSKAKTSELEVRSLHFYCGHSKRYFVVYGMVTPDKSAQHEEIFKNMLKSFKCHTFLPESKERNFPLELQ